MSIYQLLQEIVLMDLTDCVNYSLVIYEHLFTSITSIISLDIPTSLENLGLAVHKSPVVYR